MATLSPIPSPLPLDSESEEESHYARIKPPSGDQLRYTLDCYEPSQALSPPEVEGYPPQSHYATVSSGYATCSSEQRTLEGQSRSGETSITERECNGDRETERESGPARPTASLGACVSVLQEDIPYRHSLESGVHSQPVGFCENENGDLQDESEPPSRFRSRPLLAIMRQLQDLSPTLCTLLKEADSQLHRGHLEKAIKSLEKSLLQASEYPRLHSLIWMILGMVNVQLRRYKKASVCYLRYLAFCRDMQDFPGMTRAECTLGIVYMKQGLLKLAGRCFMQYLENSQILQDDVGVAAACSNLGTVSKMLGVQGYKAALREGEARQAMADLATHLYRAVTYFEQHLDIMEHYGDLEKQARAYGNLGACYELLKQHTQAIFCHNKRLEIVRVLGDKASESCVLCNLGNCFRATGKLQEAIEYYHLGYELAQVTGSEQVEMVALLNLGATSELSNELNKAVEWHTLYLSLAVKRDDTKAQARALSAMAGLFEEMGQMTKAQLYYTKLTEVFKKLGDSGSRLTTARYLQTIKHPQEPKRRTSKSLSRSRKAHSISHIPAHSHTSLHTSIERSLSKRNKLGTWPDRKRQQHCRDRGTSLPTFGLSASCRVVFENPASEFLQEQYQRQEELASEIAEQAYLSSHADQTPRSVSPDSTLCFPYTYHSNPSSVGDRGSEADPRCTLVRRCHAPLKCLPSSPTDPPPLPPRRYCEVDNCVEADIESETDYESVPDSTPPHPPPSHMISGHASSQESDSVPLQHQCYTIRGHTPLQYSYDSERTLSVCSTCSSVLWGSVEDLPGSDCGGSLSEEGEEDKEWEQWLSMRALSPLTRVVSMSRGQIRDHRLRLVQLKPTHSAPHELSLDTTIEETPSEGE